MRVGMLIVLGLFPIGPALGNEALDLLEKGTAGRGSQALGFSSRVSATPTPTPTVAPVARDSWDPDYSRRWMAQLPPLWSFYRKEGNPVVQEVALTGLFEWRYEGGAINPDGEGLKDQQIDSSRARRARLGAVLSAFYNTDLEAGVAFDGDGNYEGIDKLKATVHLGEDLSIGFGKFRPPFSLEYSQDPSVRSIPELSPLVAQIVPANSLGVMASGDRGSWDWRLGWFSSDRDENLPGIEGSGYLLASVGYSFQGAMGKASDDGTEAGGLNPMPPTAFQRWHLDYLYNFDGDQSSSVSNGYDQLVAAGLQISNQRFDFQGDFLVGNGENATTVWGVTLQSGYWLVDDAVRAVARYHFADTDDEGGLRVGWGVPSPETDPLQPFRYPVVRTGDELHTFYGGLNFHLFGDYLLLQAGLEYRLLKNDAEGIPNFESWMWQAGGRAAF